jgi:hypothetical protein
MAAIDHNNRRYMASAMAGRRGHNIFRMSLLPRQQFPLVFHPRNRICLNPPKCMECYHNQDHQIDQCRNCEVIELAEWSIDETGRVLIFSWQRARTRACAPSREGIRENGWVDDEKCMLEIPANPSKLTRLRGCGKVFSAWSREIEAPPSIYMSIQ